MRITIRNLQEMKERGEKIAMLTAYDHPTARMVDEGGVPMILVGDSVGNNVLGYGTTVPVTMDDMIHHLRAVLRGAKKAHIVCDMPFMSYQADTSEAVRNAGQLLKEGAQSVKIEGGRGLVPTISRMVETGIPVMGHIGLMPQSVNQTSGYRVQGRDEESAQDVIEDALALEEAGVYSLLLETIPAESGADDYREGLGADHRDRGGRPLRRAGARVPRRVRHQRRSQEEARAEVCLCG